MVSIVRYDAAAACSIPSPKEVTANTRPPAVSTLAPLADVPAWKTMLSEGFPSPDISIPLAYSPG